ncbi:hypothetical protein SOVF_211480, partial [Spinacia oleracea]
MSRAAPRTPALRTEPSAEHISIMPSTAAPKLGVEFRNFPKLLAEAQPSKSKSKSVPSPMSRAAPRTPALRTEPSAEHISIMPSTAAPKLGVEFRNFPKLLAEAQPSKSKSKSVS